MNKEKFLFCERLRIITAKDFDIPPDDIDMQSIIECCERAIRESCQNDSGECCITFDNKREEEAITSEHGDKITEKIFAKDPPFFDWVDKYEEFYVQSLLDRIKNRKDKK